MASIKTEGLYHLLKKDNVYIVDFNYKGLQTIKFSLTAHKGALR